MVFLFLLIDIITTLNRFEDVAGKIYVGYYVNYLPWIASQMMPVASVMAVVFLLVSLQRHHELIVLHSLGLSIYRVLQPVLFCILLFSLFSWYLADKVVPKAMEKRNYYYYVEMKKNPGGYNKLKKENIWFRTPEAIVHFGKTLSNGEIRGAKVFFYDNKKWKPTRVLESKKLELKDKEWTFKEGAEVFYTNDSMGEVIGVETKEFDVKSISPLEDLTDFKKRQSRAESMSLSELSYAIEKAKASGMSFRILETEYYGKLSFIFSALFLSFLAVPLVIGKSRSSNVFVGMGLSIFIVLAYWVVYSTFLNMGKSGLVPPIVAAWSPGLLALLVFFLLMKRKTY